MSGQILPSRRTSWSDDGDLAEEIQLYGDLVVAASESERPLTPGEIDVALGLGAGERTRPLLGP